MILSIDLAYRRPNIAVLGLYNLDDLRRNQPLVDISEPPRSLASEPPRGRTRSTMEGMLPTDSCKTEEMMSITSYVTILEDLLLRLQINVAVAKGFQDLEFPHPAGHHSKKYIDLWPIQMSAEIAAEGDCKQNVLTTNFDTCAE